MEGRDRRSVEGTFELVLGLRAVLLELGELPLVGEKDVHLVDHQDDEADEERADDDADDRVCGDIRRWAAGAGDANIFKSENNSKVTSFRSTQQYLLVFMLFVSLASPSS